MRHCNLLRAWLEETEQPYLWGAGAIIVGRRGTYRILTGAALTWFGVTAAVGLTAAPAHADGVEQVTVTGEGLVEPLEVRGGRGAGAVRGAVPGSKFPDRGVPGR